MIMQTQLQESYRSGPSTKWVKEKKRENRSPRISENSLIHIHRLLLDTPIHQHLGLLLLLEQISTVHPVGNLALLGDHGTALLPLAQFLADEVLARSDDLAVRLALAVAGQLAGQTAFGEDTLAALADLLDALHGVDGGGDQVAVVLDGDVALLGELRQHQRRVDDHLLAACGAVALGPFQLARLTLHLEVLVALAAAETELSGVIADECDALPWEGRAGTEVAGLHTGREEVDVSRVVILNANLYELTAWLLVWDGSGLRCYLTNFFFLGKRRSAWRSWR